MFLIFVLFSHGEAVCNTIEKSIQTLGLELLTNNGTSTPICLPSGNNGNVTIDQILFGSGQSFTMIPATLQDGARTVRLNCSLSSTTLMAFLTMKGDGVFIQCNSSMLPPPAGFTNPIIVIQNTTITYKNTVSIFCTLQRG